MAVATMPQDVKKLKIEETVTLFRRKTKAINYLVQRKAPDSKIMRAFQDLNDIFHRIIEKRVDKKNDIK